jgi:hypothetical protein
MEEGLKTICEKAVGRGRTHKWTLIQTMVHVPSRNELAELLPLSWTVQTKAIKKGKVLMFGPASINDEAFSRLILRFGLGDRLQGFAGLGIDYIRLAAGGGGGRQLLSVRQIRKRRTRWGHGSIERIQ